VQYFLNGKTKMESAYKNGLRSGQVIYFYPDGLLYYTGFYTADLKSGSWEYFTEEGISDTIINYNE
jgi:antitoxin component YwqK of YwqJK toxin-antitoxin module